MRRCIPCSIVVILSPILSEIIVVFTATFLFLSIAGAKIQYFERASKKFPLFIANTYLAIYSEGADDETDLLAVSCSSTDYIGHQVGTHAVETEDTYLRLDKAIADFLPDASVAILAAMLWRAIFYYPFLVMDTLVLPKWIARK